jgi:hypothetical protein
MPASLGRRDSGRAGAPPAAGSAGKQSSALFLVEYADDDPYLFWNGTRMQFGRDDEVCQIPIWEQIRDRALSKVAGELWCNGEQMWVRNLSTAHELVVADHSGRLVLPARADNDPGHACSVPAPRGTVSAPSTGSWTLTVTRMTMDDAEPVPHVEKIPVAGETLRVENIPERHREAAEALCAPLLAGGSAPATYAEVAARMGWTERVARRRVEALCAHYREQIEALPGGRLPGETLTQAVARALVNRKKVAVERPGPERDGSGAVP